MSEPMRVVVELEVIDDGRIRVELGQEERRAEPAMADDQVGAKLGMGLARLEDGVRSARSLFSNVRLQ